MADSRPSDQSGKRPEIKKSAVSKLFKSLLKKQPDELDHPNTPNSSLKEESATTAHVTISYNPVTQPHSSATCDDVIPQTSSAASYDEPPDQRLLAKQQRLLRRLHSTLVEATAITEELLILYKHDD
ncbi:hypothetical protein GFV_13g0080 [Bracoviriform facetosae]|uniref:Uncharacterized protein n=1 Tax=Bracoviriform facetosae TaxID=2083300 RepID=B8PQ68_9VIRU|nr:hypothetical protein GFV_13g0080 [Bracoviriform facetosae]ACE75494.1 hypothetical protein GFV_13g0080 [Bracoviriform facetosae]